MKIPNPLLVFAFCVLLSGCATDAPGPAPLPSVVCDLRCADPNAALEYGSVLELRLVDFTRTDSRPAVLAERIESNPGQPPLRFHLLYNASAIDPTHDYGVEVRILLKGRPLWVQPDPVPAPAITKGHPNALTIVLQPPT